MLAAVLLGSNVATVGDAAPPFFLDTLGGGTLTIHALRGHPALINVFATWCPPCKMEVPALVKASRTHPGVRFVFVDEQETPAQVTRFVHRYAVASTVAIDGGAFEATYGVGSIPTTFVLDAHGVVRAIHRGPLTSHDVERMLSDATH